MSSLPRSAGCEGQSGRRRSPRLSGHVEATDDRGPRGLGGEGRSFAKTLQVNHLAPFLLTNLLLDLLIASNNTVVHTASSAARAWGNINLDDLQNNAKYSAREAYVDAKGVP